ncbi:hypothetical protein BCR44DRAFT_195257, partial [Catenaria anguillulae PL171]
YSHILIALALVATLAQATSAPYETHANFVSIMGKDMPIRDASNGRIENVDSPRACGDAAIKADKLIAVWYVSHNPFLHSAKQNVPWPVFSRSLTFCHGRHRYADSRVCQLKDAVKDGEYSIYRDWSRTESLQLGQYNIPEFTFKTAAMNFFKGREREVFDRWVAECDAWTYPDTSFERLFRCKVFPPNGNAMLMLRRTARQA